MAMRACEQRNFDTTFVQKKIILYVCPFRTEITLVYPLMFFIFVVFKPNLQIETGIVRGSHSSYLLKSDRFFTQKWEQNHTWLSAKKVWKVLVIIEAFWDKKSTFGDLGVGSWAFVIPPGFKIKLIIGQKGVDSARYYRAVLR